MKLCRYLKLEQETEFVNIKLEKDNKLFIDPFLLKTGESNFCRECYQKVENFFQKLVKYAKEGKDKEAYKLVRNLYEREETRLGYSLKSYSGKGFSKTGGMALYRNIKESQAFSLGILEDIFDCAIMLDKIGEDKISDFITSLIFLDLITFTQEKCKEYHIPIEEIEIVKKCWNSKEEKWEKIHTKLPLDKKKNPIVFTPKEIVDFHMMFSYQKIYQDFYIPFYEQQELQNGNEKLIIRYKNGRVQVNRKELKKKYPCNKKKILELIHSRKEEYRNYKKKLLETKIPHISPTI